MSESLPSTFAVFCNPESRRAEGFSIAVGKLLRERPMLVPWLGLTTGNSLVTQMDSEPRFLRLESPGRNWAVEKQLLRLGAWESDPDNPHDWRRMSPEEVGVLENEPGRVLPMRQWFLGWKRVLDSLAVWATQAGFQRRWLCPPDDVVCMFDKHACQQVLENAKVPIPPSLGVPGCFDELWEWMRRAGRCRIFLKPCHGSSASGVVALETNRTEVQAFSTLEIEERPQGLRLFNRRRIGVHRGHHAVRRLVDNICRERCQAQVWIPKAGLLGRPFDLRVVVIGRRARHVMVRLGRGPMTNSQLLGGKADAEMVQQRMGDDAWHAMLGVCESVLQLCFPKSLYAGLDVLVEPDFRTVRILEVNAFGDLLPRVLCEGRDTYTWEIEEALRRAQSHVSATGA